MVKNIPTIERSTKIRFGKHVSDSQAENTLVFNASNTEISTPNPGSIYMAPLRVEDVNNANFFAYNSTTKEVVDSGVRTSLLGGITLDEAVNRGNTTSNIVEFNNVITSFVTSSNVGISNSAPTHALSVKDKIFMCGSGTTLLDVKGTSKSDRIISGTAVTIDKDEDNKIQVTGTIKTGDLHADNIGVANTAPTDLISIGGTGQVVMNIPTESTNAFWTSGNVYAQKYLGDGSLLDNITLENVLKRPNGNIVSIPFESSNIITGIKTLGNVQVDTTHGSFLGKITGSNTISASTITTDTPIASTSGGTGHKSIVKGDILFGNHDSDNTWGILQLATDNTDRGKYLRIGKAGETNEDIPYWDDVSSNLESIVSNGPETANITSNTIQFVNTATGLETTGNIIVGTNVYAAEFISTDTPIASTSGGTGHKIIAKGDILYGDHVSNNTLARLSRAGDDSDRGKYLRLHSSDDIPYWDDVSSNLESIVNNGPATANITSNVIQFTGGLYTGDNITINSGKKIDYATELILKSSAGSRQPFKVENAIILDPDWAEPAATTNVLAIKYGGTGEIEIFDSGGKGGSTFENIHENAANVTIGPGAVGGPSGVSNLTINTYESNVLTVTGNISADNITIGALHVAASPFNLDDVCSAGSGANVTSNIVQFTGASNAIVITNNIKIGADAHIGNDANIANDVVVTGNAISQNLQLTNTKITATYDQSTTKITIDALNKSYGAAELVTVTADIDKLDISNLPIGGQVVIPLLASGTDVKVLKSTTEGIDYIAFTNDVSISSGSHGLMTVSKLGISSGKIYMNAIAFTAA